MVIYVDKTGASLNADFVDDQTGYLTRDVFVWDIDHVEGSFDRSSVFIRWYYALGVTLGISNSFYAKFTLRSPASWTTNDGICFIGFFDGHGTGLYSSNDNFIGFWNHSRDDDIRSFILDNVGGFEFTNFTTKPQVDLANSTDYIVEVIYDHTVPQVTVNLRESSGVLIETQNVARTLTFTGIDSVGFRNWVSGTHQNDPGNRWELWALKANSGTSEEDSVTTYKPRVKDVRISGDFPKDLFVNDGGAEIQGWTTR